METYGIQSMHVDRKHTYLLYSPSGGVAIVHMNQKLFILGSSGNISDVTKVDGNTEASTDSYLLVSCLQHKGSTRHLVKFWTPK